MQALNKRFYNTFCPAIVNTVKLYSIGNVGVGLVVFPKQDYINLLIPSANADSLCSWQKKSFEMAPDTDWQGLTHTEVEVAALQHPDEEEKNGPIEEIKVKVPTPKP